MSKAYESFFRPLIGAVILGMVLGGLAYVGLFFWQNREMCPCAPVGLVDSPESVIAAPASSEELHQGVVISSLGGGAAGALAAVVFVLPSVIRMNRLLNEEE